MFWEPTVKEHLDFILSQFDILHNWIFDAFDDFDI